jgi:hypothetical protein
MVSARGTRRAARRRVKWAAGIALVVVAAGAFWLTPVLRDVFGKRYEYEEDLTINLDGTARLTVNASIAALVALRGLDLDPHSDTVDRDRVRAAFESPVARVRSVPRPWLRRGRRFVQINLQIDDILRLHECPPLSWSRYELFPYNDEEHLFRQTVGPSALRPGTLKNVGWDGSEVVAFRVHLPSRIVDHNARDLKSDEPEGISRGNILAWEQHLTDRLDGRPVKIEVRMESASILYRTLWLFAGAFTAAVLTLIAFIYWIVRRGRNPTVDNPQ